MNTSRELSTGLLSIAAITLLVLGAVSMTFAEASLMGTVEQPPIGANLPFNVLPGKQYMASPGTRSPIIITQTPYTCAIPKGWELYIIQAGDTLANLAAVRTTTSKLLMDANCMFSPLLVVGSTLYLPKPQNPTQTVQTVTISEGTLTSTPVRCGAPLGWIRYIVQPNDSLFKLSLSYRVSIPDLQMANCLTSTLIRTGEILYVPNVPTRMPSLTSIPPSKTSTLIFTPIVMPSKTSTATLMPSRTNTIRPSSTSTRTSTSSSTATRTATLTPSPTSTATSTATSTRTSTATSTATATSTPNPMKLP